jgi:LuxR family maltose regulon positive regulatory protein
MLLELIVAVEAMWTGDFARALEIITAQRQLSQSPTVSPLALTSLKNIESMYYMLTAERDPCLAAMEEGLRIARETGVYIWSNQFLVNGAAGALGAGDFENADKLLNEAQAHAEGARRLDMCLYHYCRGWEAMLHRDNLRAFQEHKQALKLAIDVGSPYFEVQCRMALSQALFHYDDERRVVSHLREVHRVARKIHNYLLEFMCLLGYAQLALARGRRRSGLNSLRYALALGRERGYKHFLGWQPKVMAELCVYALDAGIEAEYVKELIRKRSLVPEASPISVQDWPWGFKIFTLGQFQLLKQDQIVTFAGKAQRRPMDLLRALIAFGAKEVNDDRLTEALWPRIDHDFAHRSFTTTLHRLRKLLGEDKMLVLKDGRLSLDARYCWLDMWALEDVLTRSERLLAGREGRISAEQVAELADKVLDLYRGPFMHSEADRSWYVSPRERLRTKFLRTMAEFARYWEGDGEWTKAVEYYQKALEADELAEGLYRHLMICYQRLGRRGEAIETYNRCRQTLSTMLNIEPSAETKGLYETLLRNV